MSRKMSCLLCLVALMSPDAMLSGAPLATDSNKPLPLDWTQGQPKELWRAKIGWGYSALAVRGNRVYTVGYSFAVDGHYNSVYCLDADSGKVLWRHTVSVRASGLVLDKSRGNMPTLIGIRATPVLDGDFLYAFHQDGKVVCLKATNGQQVWLKDLEKDPATAGATLRPAFCYAGSPLILDHMLILAAGTAGLGLSKKTGDLLWTSGPDAAGQASPVLFRQGDKSRLAVFSADKLCTLDPADGKTLWSYPWAKATFPIAPAPVVIGNSMILAAAGQGAALIPIGSDKPAWTSQDLAPRAATPILLNGCLYGPNQTTGSLVSIDAKDGSTRWTQKLDAGGLTLVNGKLIVLSRTGELTLVAPSPKAFKSLGSFRAIDSDECWTPPAVAGSRLLVRDWEGDVVALDLSTLVPPPVVTQAPAPVIPPFRPAAPTDWYQWRGPSRNGISPETGLHLDWNETPPKLLFRRDIGYGYATAAVAGDRLYTLGWSWRTGKDTLFCLNANNGDIVWTHSYDADAACWIDKGRGNIPNYMGTRATPALDGDRLYSLAADGQTFCLDAATGKVIWYRNLKEDKEAQYNPEWFLSGSPLVVGNTLILATKAAGIAVDKMTGKTLWANAGMAGLASPVLFTQGRKPRCLLRSSNEIFVVDPADGKIVWRYRWGHGYDCADPLPMGDNVLLCGAYGKNSRLVPMTPPAGTQPAEPLWSTGKLLPHVASPILYKGYVYTPSGYLGDSILVCADPQDGSFKWAEKTRVEGILIADGKIIAQGSTGTVFVADASPDGYKECGKLKALSSAECWIAPILSGGRLFLRSWEGEFVALDLRAQAHTQRAPASPTETRKAPAPPADTQPAPASPIGAQSQPVAADDWPCWRGPAGNSNSAWVPASLPPQAQPRWKKPMIGLVYSGVAVAGGSVIVLDHEKGRKDIVRCLQADTGEEVWKHTCDNTGEIMQFGSCPRATPVIHNGAVYTLGARGHLRALDLAKGNVLWQRSLASDFRASVPVWGYCSSPLVVGDWLIVNPGSVRYSLVALDIKSGKTAWSSTGAAANYGSFLLAKVKGDTQIIGYDQETIAGRSPANGSVIWSKPIGRTNGYLVPSPVVYDNKLLLCGEDGAHLQVLGSQGNLPENWDGSNEDYRIGDATPTLAGDLALAVMADMGLAAIDLTKDLRILWSAGEKDMAGQFANVIAGNGRALVLDAAGTLFLFDVQRAGARLLGKLKVCGETRAAPALAGGRLYVRDEKAAYCYDLRG